MHRDWKTRMWDSNHGPKKSKKENKSSPQSSSSFTPVECNNITLPFTSGRRAILTFKNKVQKPCFGHLAIKVDYDQTVQLASDVWHCTKSWSKLVNKTINDLFYWFLIILRFEVVREVSQSEPFWRGQFWGLYRQFDWDATFYSLTFELNLSPSLVRRGLILVMLSTKVNHL